MKNLFAPYELASTAKEKGFNEPCFAAWINMEGQKPIFKLGFFDKYSVLVDKDLKLQEYIYAPLYPQLVDWFREKHIHIIPSIRLTGKPKSAYYFYQVLQENENHNYWISKPEFKDIDEALKEAFKLI
jgi:hypothetical protein